MKNLIVAMTILCLVQPASATGQSCGALFASPTYVRFVGETGADIEVSDRLTFEVMRQVAERTESHQDTVLGWLDSIKQSQMEFPLNALEHSALLYIIKSGIFDDYPDPQVQQSLHDSLSMSYLHLTGHSLADGQWLTPLPRKVLVDAGERVTVFHDSLFEGSDGKPKPGLTTRLRRIVNRVSPMTVVTTILSVAAMCFETTRGVFAGGLIGLAGAAFNEDLIHLGVGHAEKVTTLKFRKFGVVGRFLEQITLAHKLHHTIAAEDFGAAVLTPEQKARADKTLTKLVENLTLERMQEKNPDVSADDLKLRSEFGNEVERLVTAIKKSGYGVDGTWRGAAGMLAAATPYYLLNFALYAATGSPEFLISSQVSLTVMILQSLYSHWYLHYRPEDDPTIQTNPIQTFYMNTYLGRQARRLHFTHHELPYKSDRTANGDIMAG